MCPHLRACLAYLCALHAVQGLCHSVRTVQVTVLEQAMAKLAAGEETEPEPVDPWAELPTAEELMPKILTLWHQLNIPLIERSQFLVAHTGKGVYHFLAEHDHLLELQRRALTRLLLVAPFCQSSLYCTHSRQQCGALLQLCSGQVAAR